MRRIPHTLLLGLGCLVATACAPAITYPPKEGVMSSRLHPDEPVPTLMARAIDYAHREWGDGGDLIVNLPAGTPPAVYDKVFGRLGGGRPMEYDHERAYHVTQVSSQGNEGLVDLFYPKPDGSYGFATLTFRLELVGGYQHHLTRVWQTGEAPPPPSYPATVAGTAPEE